MLRRSDAGGARAAEMAVERLVDLYRIVSAAARDRRLTEKDLREFEKQAVEAVGRRSAISLAPDDDAAAVEAARARLRHVLDGIAAVRRQQHGDEGF